MAKRNKSKLDDGLGPPDFWEGSSPSYLTENIPLDFIEQKVRFSLRSCEYGNRYCILKLTKEEIEKLYNRLGYFEEMTHQVAQSLPRDKGFSIEKKRDANHKDLKDRFPQYNTFLHFRVTGTDTPFRVFGAIQDGLTYILQIDRGGKKNH